jgi:hypothetical protein
VPSPRPSTRSLTVLAAVSISTRQTGWYATNLSQPGQVSTAAGSPWPGPATSRRPWLAGRPRGRSAAAVTAVIAAIVLPYLLATAGLLPAGASQWLLRVTPAAAFAIQQSVPQYPQVTNAYTPFNGYYPLAPWAGFAVLCGWAVLALGLAVFLLRRRDA